MKVNISDLAPSPSIMSLISGTTEPSDVEHNPIGATELSLDEMRKYSGTGIYLLSAVVD